MVSVVVGGLLWSRSAHARVTTTTPPSNGNGGAVPGNGGAAPSNGLPDLPDLPPPVRPTTAVQDPVTAQTYNVPLPSSPRRITRNEAGVILPTPQLLLGQRAGFIEAWPSGAEMLWGYVRTVGPARAYYDVEVAEQIPYQNAYHDVRPTQLHEHQVASGQTVRIKSGEVINAIV